MREYTAAPLFASDGKGFVHQWLVEFRKEPSSLKAFTEALDKELRAVNSDYDAKRSKDIVMQMPLHSPNFIPSLGENFRTGNCKKLGKVFEFIR